MGIPKEYSSDIEGILARRFDNGWDLWATPDKKLGVGSPFSTLQCALMLSELGISISDPILKRTADLIFSTWQKDGRFRLAPKQTIYPCHTAAAARVLCRLGYIADKRLIITFKHFLKTQYNDGGWRCNTYKFGKGPETAFSNPGPTLEVLDAFRFTSLLNTDNRLDKAVEFLLNHWETKKPLGPCHFGIGTLFMKVEYPFFRYNIFFYVYVLSFYNRARKDSRFKAALLALEAKLETGKMVVENSNRQLADFDFCRKGKPSYCATRRYREILKNTGKAVS